MSQLRFDEVVVLCAEYVSHQRSTICRELQIATPSDEFRQFCMPTAVLRASQPL